MYKRNIETHSRNYYALERIYLFLVCVCSLGHEHKKHKRCIVLSSVACFPHLINGTNFGKSYRMKNVYFVFPYKLSLNYFSFGE